MNVPSVIDQAQCHIPMEGAQTLAVPGSPVASGPGAVQLAGVVTHQSQVLQADAPQGGGLLAGIPIVGRPDATAVTACGRFMRPPPLVSAARAGTSQLSARAAGGGHLVAYDWHTSGAY